MLASIEVTARQALSELRRLLGVLRKEEDQVDFAPQPGLDQLDSLVEQVRVAGVPVEVSVSGVPEALSPGVNLSVYRIVQEALTNVLKHGGGASTRVAMQFGHGGLDLAITDSGRGAPTAGARAWPPGSCGRRRSRDHWHARAGGDVRGQAVGRATARWRLRGSGSHPLRP